MNEKTIRILEFEKIKSRLAELTVSSLGRDIAESLMPQTNYSTILNLLKETDDGVAFW